MKRKPTDATYRNVRAGNRKIADLERRVRVLEAQVRVLTKQKVWRKV